MKEYLRNEDFPVLNVAVLKSLLFTLVQEENKLTNRETEENLKSNKNYYNECIETGFLYVLKMCHDLGAYHLLDVFILLQIIDEGYEKQYKLTKKFVDEVGISSKVDICNPEDIWHSEAYFEQFVYGFDLDTLRDFIEAIGRSHMKKTLSKEDLGRAFHDRIEFGYVVDDAYLRIGLERLVEICYKHNNPTVINILSVLPIVLNSYHETEDIVSFMVWDFPAKVD